MVNNPNAKIVVKLSAIIDLIGDKMYDSDEVFVRENVQNALDAIRLLSFRTGRKDYKVNIKIKSDLVEIEDWGIGMTPQHIIDYYWHVGSSSKNTEEARMAGCIGQLGIGGFANFKVCREIHVYSMADANPKNEIHTYVSYADLKQDNDKVAIESSQVIRHQGTLIRCYPKDHFDVEAIISYLTKYIEHLPESIFANGVLISQNIFVNNTNPKSSQEQTINIPDGNIQGTICEYEKDNRITYRIEKINLSGIEYSAAGELEPAYGNLLVYKHKFLITDYRVAERRLTGKLDLPFVKPVADRDNLDKTTAQIVKNIHDAIFTCLVNHISHKTELINSYRGTTIIEYIYRHDEYLFLDNLSVTLIDSTRLTLKDIRGKAKSTPIYYLSRQVTPTAQALQHTGSIIVHVDDLDMYTRRSVTTYLSKFCGASEIPDIFPTSEIPFETLDGNQKLVILSLQKILERRGCSHIKVIVCLLEPQGKMPILLDTEKSKLFVDITHRELKKVTEYTDNIIFEGLVDRFLNDYAGEGLSRASRKLFGPYGMGLDFISPDDRVEILLEYVEDVHLVRNAGHSWEGEDANLINIQGDDFPNMNGYYLRLPTEIEQAYKQYIYRENKVGVVWFVRTVIILVYHDINQILKFEIEVEKPIQIEPDEADKTYGGVKENRLALIYPKGIYIPLYSLLESYFIPKGFPKKIWIRPKLMG